ncbi:diguanylate cyclase [Undibacterium rugosum]|uniref:diguanylate cyclase n=2 Tax=Undibacterium TaxID=401469 RepID=A0A923I352_9BURK|nr:diguanylate cyclase [Undibacterium rugosum]MBC3936914.1 diguanylate cyclase [Undibacterium rugosum]MBR7779430.1 diguanylate cyclase [Undibacterium rugosum]
MNSKNDSLLEKLRALEAVFLQKLPGKCEEIISALNDFAAHPDNKDALTVLHRHLHTMAGSAGTFGFSELGLQARAFESRIKPWLVSPVWTAEEVQHLATELRHYFTHAVADLRQAPDHESELMADLVHGEDVLNETRLIYLVDEDEDQQAAITLQLEHFGYEVRRIPHLKDLALAIATRRPDVIVIELSFPEGKNAGVDEIKRIEQLQRLRIPTIFISKTSSFESRLLAVRAKGDGYFTKPVDVVALTERIDTISQRDLSNGYRILIIDDDVVTAKFYGAILRDVGMNVRLLNDPTQVLAVMTDFRPELLLLDVYMPVCSGVELSRLIRQDNSYVDVPIVFLSSEADVNKQLDAVKAGADDFITKPVPPEYLVSSLSTRAERYRSLRALIMRDGLTGLLNHTAIKEQLEAEVLQAHRNGAPLALAMIDLDNFKKINDSYGHATGDQVLRTLARILRQRLRRTDIVGRYGGEEFAVIFPDTTASTARRVLDKVRQAFSKVSQHSEDVEFSVTFSAGVADMEKANDPDQLFDVADTAMYVSKQEGRNRITLA